MMAWRKSVRHTSKVGLLAVAGMLLGCNPLANENRSAVNIVLTKFREAGIGAQITGKDVDVVSDSGEATDTFITITVESHAKSAVTTPNSNFYSVTIQGYHIGYTRLDGRNEPGVDVPFPLTSPTHGYITPGGNNDMGILLMPRQSKLEAPLRNLWFTDERIQTRMSVTVFGQDLVGNEVAASAAMDVRFGDFRG